jgi:hypothetical protein
MAIHSQQADLERLDARVRKAEGQLGLDLGGSKGPNGGEPCGAGWISPDKTCHKGAGGAAAVETPAAAKTYRPTPQVKAGVSAKPMTLNPGGDTDYDPSAEKAKAKGGLKYSRSRQGGTVTQRYLFRDRQAAEHWYANDNALSDADVIAGAYDRRRKEWQAEYKASYEGTRNILRDASDYDLLKTMESYAMAGSATRGGTATDLRIGGNKHSRPIREGVFTAMAPAGPLLTNPGREDPGLAPKVKPAGINALDVTTSKQQAQLARQQQAAAKASGDQRGIQAWKKEERTVERHRLAAAMTGGKQSQSSLFGVTEYDETMPLFRPRKDAVDPVSRLLGEVLAEQLPGAQVLDWGLHPRGITAGRVASEGLVYRFRCDAETVAYQPGWDGINEEQWALRSEGFLVSRDPRARMDFQKVKFQQQSSKRKCVKGYGCGSSCIAMQKECRINPSSAMSKARLKQLQTLAKEGNASAGQTAERVQQQRNQKAGALREGRQVEQLKKLMADPRVAEMIRTGKFPEGGAQGPAKPGDVRNMPPTGVEVDAERFQYKIGASASGEVGSLSGVEKWDPNLAGVISVWQDPEDGKTYVINGHNRLALAKRLGADDVTVRYLDAKDAQEARAIGAMQNIAEGAGKETDAAKFFRDTGITSMEQVKAKGLPLNSGKAERGLALAQLPEEMFQDVIQGNLRVRRAAVIGGSGLDQDKQREVYKVLKQRPSMTDETLSEYVEHLAVSQRQTQTEINLFGSSTKSVDTGLARAELSNGLKKSLSREARLLGAVSKNSQAVDLLEKRGGNVINVAQSQQQAQEASSVLRVFNQLKSSGATGAALDQAAARLAAGENKAKVQRELRESVIRAMELELEELGLRKPAPRNEAPTASLFDAVDRLDSAIAMVRAISVRLDSGAGIGPNGGVQCGAGWIDPNKTCRIEQQPDDPFAAPKTGKEWLDENVKSRYPNQTRGKIEVIGVVELAEPVEQPYSPLPAVDARYGVELKNYTSSSEDFRKKVGDAIGVDLGNSEQWDMSFDTGLGDAALTYTRNERMPKDASRKLATAIRIEVDQIISRMKDNTVLTCTPYTQDGLGDKRRKLYERAGFYTYDDQSGSMVALVRGGRIMKSNTLGMKRQDGDDEIDIEQLVFELITLNSRSAGGGKGLAGRLDGLQLRLTAIQERLQEVAV